MTIPSRITIRLTSRQRIVLADAARELSTAYPMLGEIGLTDVIDCAIDCLANELEKGQGLLKPNNAPTLKRPEGVDHGSL